MLQRYAPMHQYREAIQRLGKQLTFDPKADDHYPEHRVPRACLIETSMPVRLIEVKSGFAPC